MSRNTSQSNGNHETYLVLIDDRTIQYDRSAISFFVSQRKMLTATLYATGILVTASTIPWESVIKGIGLAWSLVSHLRSQNQETTIETYLETIISISEDRDALPHVDVFCDLLGWTRDRTLDRATLTKEIESKIGGYLFSGDLRHALSEIIETLTHLTGEYIRSGPHLFGPDSPIEQEEFHERLLGLYPYWCSMGESDHRLLLERYHVGTFIELLQETETFDERKEEILRHWIVGRPRTIKSLSCLPKDHRRSS